MPFSPLDLIAPGIGLISSLGEGLFNISAQNKANEQNQKNMMMQRQWSIDDWNRNNAYNSPAAQMERFKAAGLNPNLIYGQTNTAAPVRSSDTARIQAPQVNGLAQSMLAGFMAMYDLQKKQAETNNLEKQKDLIEANIRLANSNIANRNFDLGYKKDALDYNLEFLQQRNRNLVKDEFLKDQVRTNMETSRQVMLDNNERQAIMTAANAKVAAQRVLNMRMEAEKTGIGKMLYQQQIKNLEQNYRLGSYEERLNESGKTKSDNALIRAIESLWFKSHTE